MSSDASGTAAETDGRVPTVAALLGAGGLIPFVLGAAGLWLAAPELHARIASALSGWSAVILAFMGAVHWGARLDREDGRARAMTISVLPAIAGWLMMMQPPVTGTWQFAVAFGALYLLDRREAAAGRLPAWYPRLRRPLTAVVVASLVAAGSALRAHGAG